MVMKKFTEWLTNDAEDCGMCDPPMDAQLAVHFLCKYLLGDSWYVTMPESQKQVNTAIVFEILSKHSKDFRREWKKFLKWKKDLKRKV